MKRFTLQTLVAGVLALVLGAVAGAALRRGNIAPARADHASSTTSTLTPQRVDREPLIDSATAEAVKTGSGAERWLLVLSLVENAGPHDMPALIRLVTGDTAMIRMLAERWAELNPQHMFHWLYSESMIPDDADGALPSRWLVSSVLVEEWMKRDPAAAIKTLSDAPSFRGRENMRLKVADELMKTDVEAAFRAMKDWNIRNHMPDIRKLQEFAAQNPRRAAELVADFGTEHLGLEGLKHVAKVWAASNPQEALEFAQQLPMMQWAKLSSEIMRNWAARDLSAAIDVATAEQSPVMRAALAEGFVGEWAKKDPGAALAWSQENLRGNARTEVIGNLVTAAAEKSLESAGELIASMPEGPAQSRACASLFSTWFAKGKEHRDAAFEWLASLPNEGTRRQAIETIQWNWAWREPEAVREFIAGPHGNLASSSMIHQVARNQAGKNPEAAMRWADELPAERANDVREAVLQQWLQVRPEGALDYARNLPAGARRNAALHIVTLNLVSQDPVQAGSILRRLPTGDQAAVRKIIDELRLADDTKRALETAWKGGP